MYYLVLYLYRCYDMVSVRYACRYGRDANHEYDNSTTNEYANYRP